MPSRDRIHSEVPNLERGDFLRFQSFFHDLIGLHLPETKLPLVMARLGRRVARIGMRGFADYASLLESGSDAAETQTAIDLITTNETSFFREKAHFDLLADRILPTFPPGKPVRIWCGASSTGEEPYSLAMVLEEARGRTGWRLVATDINQEVLETARRGLYPMARSANIPPALLKSFCLRGIDEHEGAFVVRKDLRERVEFRLMNLLDLDRDLVDLDVVFLRNVLIYFDNPTRERILTSIWERMRPGAWLVLSHSESVVGLHLPALSQVKPSVYRKPT